MSQTFFFGTGRKYEAELFQEDCETPITDLGINLQHESHGMVNLTHEFAQLIYGFDDSIITSSSTFDANTWEIKICSQLKLVSDAGTIEAKDEVISGRFFDFSSSATRPVSASCTMI